jgi:putative DNA primase/helicase
VEGHTNALPSQIRDRWKIMEQFNENQLEELEERGFYIENDKLKFNANIFAEFFSRKSKYLYTEEEKFYEYIDGVFIKINELDLLKRMRIELQIPLDGTWTTYREQEYFSAFKRICTYTKGLNRYHKYINLKNGMLRIKTKELVKHSPKYFSGIQLPFEYDPKAKCELFMKFLDDIFEGDTERINLIQEWMGYLISSKMQAQKMLMFYGQGSNGKGVLSQVIEELVGSDNIANVDLVGLNRSFLRATLLNKLLIMSSENEVNGKSLNTQYIKAIVGEDKISAEFKGKDVFSFKPTCKICVSTNNLPYSKDNSEGYYRRLCIICFNKEFSIQSGKADTNLISKLKGEMPGILNFAIEGLERLIKNQYKFSPCESSDEILLEYRRDQDPVLGYIEECLVFNKKSKERESNTQIIESFRNWAKKNGHKGYADMSSKKFWQNFDNYTKRKGYSFVIKRHSNKARYCLGVSVKDEYRIFENRFTSIRLNNNDNYDLDDVV